jgi:MoxR-like ATPase
MSATRISQKKQQWDASEWAGVASVWELAGVAIAKLSRVFLWGPPGVGKSYLASRAGNSPVQVTLAEDLTVQELMGHWVPARVDWHFHLGPISRAYQDGSILVLNEIGRASGSVQDFLLGVLDSRDVASLALPNGELLTPADSFKVVGTSNSSPDQLDPALRSRFEAEIHLPVPNGRLIEELDWRCQGLGAALADSYLDPERALDPRRVASFINLVCRAVPARQAALLTLAERAPDFLAALQARGVRLPCDNF